MNYLQNSHSLLRLLWQFHLHLHLLLFLAPISHQILAASPALPPLLSHLPPPSSSSSSQHPLNRKRDSVSVSSPACGAWWSVWIRHIGLISCLFTYQHHHYHNHRASRATPDHLPTHTPNTHKKHLIDTLC